MTTDLQSELLTLVDKDNNVIGSIERGMAHSQGVYYRTIFVLVINERKEELIQKRSATKDLYPNCWDLSVGGHVIYGDSYEETATREIEEELGIKADPSDLQYKGEVLVKLPSSNEYFHVFEYKLKSTDLIQPAGEEISQIKWLGMDGIKRAWRTEV